MDHCEQNVELKDVTPNVVTKKSRGRPKLTEEEKIIKKEALKQYHKEYKQTHKEELKSYYTERYSEKDLERNKNNNRLNYEILGIIKELFMNHEITISNTEKEKSLKELINKKYKLIF